MDDSVYASDRTLQIKGRGMNILTLLGLDDNKIAELVDTGKHQIEDIRKLALSIDKRLARIEAKLGIIDDDITED